MSGRPVDAALPTAVRVWLGPGAVLAALVVAAVGIRYADRDRPGAVDSWLRPSEPGARSPWRHAALAADFLGEPVGAAALVLAAVTGCLLLRRPRAAVLVVAGAGLAVATTRLLKHVVGRTIHGGNLSYPSGHTAFLTALALSVALLVAGRFGLGGAVATLLVLGAALIAGAAMGWAQVALGAHYPTDALGGWCTALAVTPAAGWLIDRTADARRPGR
ncbi:phosphatase PAP2 family protein [Streptomyces sp. NPDC091272]|uniref:phosphatase PAP2 family protein n=1 Tax=Streptomyces sp. NPDC091272 TaxID=3365981 RepID=UPI0037FA773D